MGKRASSPRTGWCLTIKSFSWCNSCLSDFMCICSRYSLWPGCATREGNVLVWLRTWTSGFGLDPRLCWKLSVSPWADDSIPPMFQLAGCKILVFSRCIPALPSRSTAPGVMPLPHAGTTVSQKWHLDLVSSSRHGSSPSGSSLAATSNPEEAKLLLIRRLGGFLARVPVLCLGIAHRLLRRKQPSQAVQQHFGPWLPLPGPCFKISSPTVEMTQLPVKPHQNHGSFQPGVNQPWLQFTFIHQPKTVPVLMQVRALSHLLINS